MHTTLHEFIAHARTKGMDHQTIRMLLLSAGWKEKDIAAAMVSETLDMPVPVPTDGGGAKDAFFHLLTFTTLYSTVISVMVLFFEYLNRLLPDAANRNVEMYTNADASGIRWPLAVVIVSFPLFMIFARMLYNECKNHPEKLGSAIRKWLTYLTLFVTACTIIGDLITLFFYLLDGEYTPRFFLKVFVVLVMSALPLWYYFTTVRMDAAAYARSPAHRIFFSSLSVIVAVAFVWGILIAGSPMSGRMEKTDEQRINDLRQIDEAIMNHLYGPDRFSPRPATDVAVTKLPKPLPADLKEIMTLDSYVTLNTTDPETGLPYGYFVHGTSFDLCADFSLVRQLNYDIFWNHPAGHHCFTFDALDPRSK